MKPRLLLVLLISLAPTVARAADPPQSTQPPQSPLPTDNALSVDTRGAEQALDDVVVLSAKRPQPLREAAASTSVITAADLAAYGWRDFTEAVSSLAGFYTTSPGDAVYLGVRGVSLQGDVNGRILILVDGHTQNELWSHSAYPDQMGLDASMIDHIEVLRGPASSLYGSLGFLAIINIVTRRGTEQHWARANFELQNDNGFRGAASLGHRFRNGVEFGLSVQAVKSLGDSFAYPDLQNPANASRITCTDCNNGVSRPSTDAAQGLSVYGHLEWKGFSLKASYQYYDNHIPFAPYASEFNSNVNHYLTTRGYIDAGYEIGRPEKIQLSLRAYYDTATYIDDLRYVGTPATMGMAATPDYTFHDEANPFWIGGEARLLLSREWRELRVNITLGGEVTWLRGNDLSGNADDIAAGRKANYVFIQHDILFGSAYGQAELTWSRSLSLTLGLRDDFSDTYPSELSPRVGLVLFPHATSTVKFLYSHGFIHPSWYQTFFNDNVSILDNRNLAPERADNYEVVFQQLVTKPLLLTASLFYIHGDHLIEQVTVCADGTADITRCPDTTEQRQQFQNVHSFQSRGGEITLNGRFAFGLRLFANYTLAFARDGEGAQAVDSPTHMFKTGISVPLWRDHLFAGAELRVMSGRRMVPDPDHPNVVNYTAPTEQLSAHVAWRDLPRGLSVMVKVYDITGQTYYEPSVAENSVPIFQVPHSGPTVLARVGYEY